MDMEYSFNGPPEHFYEAIRTFQKQRTSGKNNDPFYWVVDIDRLRDKSHQMVWLWDARRNQKTFAFINVTNLPEGRSRLNVHIPENEITKYLPWLELLKKELRRLQWLNPIQIPMGNATMENWLNYYHEMKFSGQKYTLKDLAKDCNRSYDNIRKRHSGCPICSSEKKTDSV